MHTHSKRNQRSVGAVLRRACLLASVSLTVHAATPVETMTVTKEMSAVVGGMDEMAAGNTPIASHNDHIYWAYITSTRELKVIHKLPTGAETIISIKDPNNTANPYVVANDGYHVAPSIGIDGAGFVHLAANMHHNRWQYWKTSAALGNTFTFRGLPNRSDLTSLNPTGCPPGWLISYPVFVRDKTGRLYLSFRHRVEQGYFAVGCNGGGVAQYSTTSGQWTMLGGANYVTPFDQPSPPGGKPKTLFYCKEGPDGAAGDINSPSRAYQTYMLQMAVGNADELYVGTKIYVNGDYHSIDNNGVSTVSPGSPVGPKYGAAAVGYINATTGLRHFVTANSTVIDQASLPFLYQGGGTPWRSLKDLNGTNVLGWPLIPFTRVTGEPGSNRMNMSSIAQAGFGSSRPLAQNLHNTAYKWSEFGNSTGPYIWTQLSNQPSTRFQHIASQGTGGGKYLTGFEHTYVYGVNSKVPVRRTNDGGATVQPYLMPASVNTQPQNYGHVDQHFVVSQLSAAHPSVRIILTTRGTEFTNPPNQDPSGKFNPAVATDRATKTVYRLDFQ